MHCKFPFFFPAHMHYTKLSSNSTPPSLKTLPPPALMMLRGSIHTPTSTQYSSRRHTFPSPRLLQVHRPFTTRPVLSLPLALPLKALPASLHLRTPILLLSLIPQVPHPLPAQPVPIHTLPAVVFVPSNMQHKRHHAVAPRFHPPAPHSSPPTPPKVLTFARSLRRMSSTSQSSHNAMRPSLQRTVNSRHGLMRKRQGLMQKRQGLMQKRHGVMRIRQSSRQ